jgi:hypothetical protein
MARAVKTKLRLRRLRQARAANPEREGKEEYGHHFLYDTFKYFPPNWNPFKPLIAACAC